MLQHTGLLGHALNRYHDTRRYLQRHNAIQAPPAGWAPYDMRGLVAARMRAQDTFRGSSAYGRLATRVYSVGLYPCMTLKSAQSAGARCSAFLSSPTSGTGEGSSGVSQHDLL